MIVTINTDASYSDDHKIGAYAFWIVCNEGKILHSGILKNVADCNDAEIQCIGNALHTVYKSGFSDVKKLIINSDSINGIKRIEAKRVDNTIEGKCYRILLEIKAKYELKGAFYEFRHVKGHSGTKEKRKWVNAWCDKTARRMLREQIKAK